MRHLWFQYESEGMGSEGNARQVFGEWMSELCLWSLPRHPWFADAASRDSKALLG